MSNLPDETITPQPWLAVRREHPIRLIVIHSTRGDNTLDKQYGGTKNWLLSRDNNKGGWGSSTNRVISHEGQMCVCWPDEMSPTFSCGFGFTFDTWAVDWFAISFELAQPGLKDDFDPRTLNRAAQECAKLCLKYQIPPVWLDSVDQTGDVPTGITGHENTDNGKRFGKSDPGSDRAAGGKFDPEDFIRRVRDALAGNPLPSGGEPIRGNTVSRTPPTPPVVTPGVWTNFNGIASRLDDRLLRDGESVEVDARVEFGVPAGARSLMVELFRLAGRIEVFHGGGLYAGQVGWNNLPYLQCRVDLDANGRFRLVGHESAALGRLGITAFA